MNEYSGIFQHLGPDALWGLVQTSIQQQEFYTARQALEEAIRRDGGDVRACVALVQVAESTGDIEMALRTLDRLLAMQAARPDLVLKKADLLDKNGQYEEAEALLQGMHIEHARLPQPLYMAARIAYNQEQYQQATELVSEVLQHSRTDADQRSKCMFLLGKLYDRVGEPDKAMDAFVQGNQLNGIPFDRDGYMHEMDELIDFYSPARFRDLQRSNNSSAPIFIVSLPRSGTSLVHQILDMHPDTLGLGEAGWLVRNRFKLAQQYPAGFPGCLEQQTSEQLDLLTAGYYRGRMAPGQAGIVRTIDKSVENYRDAGFIWQLFPAAKLVFLQRNPVDCCLSIFMSRFVTQRTRAYSSALDDIAHVYRQHQRLKMHWRDNLGMPILDLDYEQLVDSPDEKIHELVEFCGLPRDDRCLRFYESRKKINTISVAQVSRPIYRESLGKGDSYRKYTAGMEEILAGPLPESSWT